MSRMSVWMNITLRDLLGGSIRRSGGVQINECIATGAGILI